MTTVLLASAAVAVGGFVLLWLISLPLRNSSIVDPFWGPGFALVAWTGFVVADDPGGRGLLVAILVTVWGARLGLHLGVRNSGKGEDFRYQAFRRRWGHRYPVVSLLTVFLLQAALLWVVALPVQAAMAAGGTPGPLAIAGVALWAVGFFFESVGDLQLVRFRRDPANQGRVMDRGLWSLTRHPNYFGDFTVWWGHFLVAFSGWDMAWTVVGPLVMSILLLRVSGVTLLEKSLAKCKPAYAEYAARTNAFLPWKPKKLTADS